MSYPRTILNGYSGPIRKLFAEELGIKSHKKHAHKRRHRNMAKPKLGSGGRFAAFKRRLEAQGKSAGEAGAIAASAGRKKYGGKKMSKMAAIGRKRAANVADTDNDNE